MKEKTWSSISKSVVTSNYVWQYIDNTRNKGNKKQHCQVRAGVLLQKSATSKPKNIVNGKNLDINKKEQIDFCLHEHKWELVFTILLGRGCLTAPMKPQLTPWELICFIIIVLLLYLLLNFFYFGVRTGVPFLLCACY